MTEQDIATPDGDMRHEALQPGALGQWFIEGARTAVLMKPAWQNLQATPLIVAALTVLGMLLAVLLQRLYIDGPATFYWQAIAGGWYMTAMLAWICYLMRPTPLADDVPGTAPSAAHLFCMVLAQTLSMALAFGLLFIVLIHTGAYSTKIVGLWGIWFIGLAPLAWSILAQLTVLWRGGLRRPQAMLVAGLMLVSGTALFYVVRPAVFWYAEEPADTETAVDGFKLTQEVMERQPQLLAQHLQAVKPRRPGAINLYAISFAPYAEEDVFRREGELVAAVMAQRFDASGRTLQLVNNSKTVDRWPWATPMNLQRAIQRMAAVMDRSEDVLFIHLTSHGAQSGELSASFWPMSVDTVKPADLKAWLDKAGIKHRVISISACFAGSWINPLADDNTLVMTASDADHTSYGCGRKSELTFFGRAMYDEQLRNRTLSFEEAHMAARKIIKEREYAAGKSDGFSNPQIRMGIAIRHRLARLQQRLQSEAPR